MVMTLSFFNHSKYLDFHGVNFAKKYTHQNTIMPHSYYCFHQRHIQSINHSLAKSVGFSFDLCASCSLVRNCSFQMIRLVIACPREMIYFEVVYNCQIMEKTFGL
jgi:hypothetical protein